MMRRINRAKRRTRRRGTPAACPSGTCCMFSGFGQTACSSHNIRAPVTLIFGLLAGSGDTLSSSWTVRAPSRTLIKSTCASKKSNDMPRFATQSNRESNAKQNKRRALAPWQQQAFAVQKSGGTVRIETQAAKRTGMAEAV